MTAGRLTRRRFLAISAASLAVGGAGPAAVRETTRWRGQALGAVAEITLRGPKKDAAQALRAVKRTLQSMERLFSLYDPASDLVKLNNEGRLEGPAREFLAVLSLCDEVYKATDGVFDPSVQPLWRALAQARGRPDPAVLAEAVSRIAWPRVTFDRRAVGFQQRGMALTFNGIAQGFATDRVTERLADFGFTETLVNIGEFRAGEGTWRIGIEDPNQGLVATRALIGGAIATSSPAALRFGDSGLGHILHPIRPARAPLWSTVSVEASTAGQADGFSTALTLLDAQAAAAVVRAVPAIKRVLLVAEDGRKIELL